MSVSPDFLRPSDQSQNPNQPDLVGSLPASVNRAIVLVQQTQAMLLNPNAPNSWGDKIGRVVVGAFPSLEGTLFRDPLAQVRTGLQREVINIYGDLQTILRTGQDQVTYYAQLTTLIDGAKNNPDDPQTLEQLSVFLQDRADQALDKVRNQETDALLKELDASATPEGLAQRREDTLTDAEIFRQVAEPIITTLQASMIALNRQFGAAKRVYGFVSQVSPSFHALRRSLKDSTEAERLQIAAFTTMASELSRTVAVADLILQAAYLAKTLRQTVDPEELRRINERANALVSAMIDSPDRFLPQGEEE